MLLTASIIIFIFELLLLGIFILLAYKNKVVFSKSNILYFVPVILLVTSLYLVGQIYANKTFDFFMLSDSLKFAFKVFAFETNKLLVEAAIKDCSLFAISFYIAIVLGGLTLVSSVLGLIKTVLINMIRVNKNKLFGADIVVGCNENAISYAKHNKNSILWVDLNTKELSNEEKGKIFDNKVAYINKPFNYKNLNSFFNKNDVYHVVIFNDNNDNQYGKYVDIFTNDLVNINATVFLHIEADNDYINFVNDQISKKAVKSKYNLIASCFNVHELVARKFMMENTLLDHANDGVIKNGLLQNDVNVFFVGFGKVNTAIFKSCVLNNQFVSVENDKLVNKPVNYYLYDQNAEMFNKEIIVRLTKDYDKDVVDENIPPLEKICNVDYKKINIKGSSFINEIESKMTKDSLNIFFVGFSNGVENASFSALLDHYFYKRNIHIYYNVDSKKEIIAKDLASTISPYGFKKEILTHDVVANDSLARLASKLNEEYTELNIEHLIKWEKLPIIEKYSNVYSAINLRFKLKMLGFEYDDILNKKISKEDYFAKLFDNRSNEEINKLLEYNDYSEYFKINTRNIMAFQEHLRWVSYYYVNGFDQMPSNEFIFDNNKLIIKELNFRRHGCMTSFYGLHNLYNSMIEIYKEHNINKTLLDVESYKYDYMVLDNLYND